MAGKRRRRSRTKVQREMDLAVLAEKVLKGWPKGTIAQYLEISPSQLSYDLKKLRERWKEEAIENTDAERQLMLRKLRLIEKEAWEAWERSRQPRKITASVKTAKGSAIDQFRHQQRSEERDGNVQFLKAVLDAIARQADILGISAESGGSAADLLTEAQFSEIASLMRESHTRNGNGVKA